MRFEHWLYTLPLKWRSLVRRTAVDRDLEDEIRYHLENQVEDLVSKGVDRAEAWREVRRSFGGVEQSKEQCRDTRGLNTIDALGQDVRYAARVLRRHPGYTRCGCPHACPRHRRQRGRLQPDRRHPPVATPIFRTRATGQRHRNLPQRRVGGDARGGPDHRRRGLRGRQVVHAQRRRGTDARSRDACVGGIAVDTWRQAGVRQMASTRRGRGEPGSLRHPEPPVVGHAFRARCGDRWTLRRARRRATRDCRRHASILPVPFVAHAGVGSAWSRSAQHYRQLGRRFHAGARPPPGRRVDRRGARRRSNVSVADWRSLSVAHARRLESERYRHPACSEAVVNGVRTRLLILSAPSRSCS